MTRLADMLGEGLRWENNGDDEFTLYDQATPVADMWLTRTVPRRFTDEESWRGQASLCSVWRVDVRYRSGPLPKADCLAWLRAEVEKRGRIWPGDPE